MGHIGPMDRSFPPPPAPGTAMSPVNPSAEARWLLSNRRSSGKRTLGVPGPTGDALDDLLTVAARVPDHRRLEPWRFITFEDQMRTHAGDRLADIYRADHPEANADDVALNATTLLSRAPTVVCVVSSPNPEHKTPVWEQELSAGAVCHQLLLAANAAGWSGAWLTEWIAYDRRVAAMMGLTATERVAGFIYLGTATANPPERPRPDMPAKITRWSGA